MRGKEPHVECDLPPLFGPLVFSLQATQRTRWLAGELTNELNDRGKMACRELRNELNKRGKMGRFGIDKRVECKGEKPHLECDLQVSQL
jgi:hypothetical protein